MSDTSEFELASSPDSSSEEEATTPPGSRIWNIDFKHMEPISVDIEALARMINYTDATGGTVMQSYWCCTGTYCQAERLIEPME
ncbi:unnamed protein product [Phytophthora fragariaefolia]|uniref:Unnamed protein product n=1 Tax=Phytophthora fragariaefolia TaxID=1490495 RepID=A0A9W6U2M9_9STRA|nr:unnamed protein product [Phytophthora fragariaefolia]